MIALLVCGAKVIETQFVACGECGKCECRELVRLSVGQHAVDTQWVSGTGMQGRPACTFSKLLEDEIGYQCQCALCGIYTCKNIRGVSECV